ncbi:MAG: tetratricopeptide repeat protein [Proteobacteria bacterium]|nr:tetratricopeptide repeat protein [Pseudomonadota bacterium]
MPTSYRKIVHCLLLGIIISLCYSNSLHAPFHFDDYPNIIDNTNSHLNELTWEKIKKTGQLPLASEKKLSRPISRLTLALNYYFSGLNTFSYHLTNIAIHCITAWFLYLLFCQLLLNIEGVRGKTLSLPDGLDTALLAATLWAIHPIQVQAVTYIVQRMASMAAMFYVIGFYCYCRFRFSRQTSVRLLFTLLALFSWLLGVFSKENAVLLPLAILCFELVFFPLTRKRKIFTLFLCLLFIVVSLLTLLTMQEGGILDYLLTPYAHRPFTMGERLLTESRIIVQYLGLILLPVNTYLAHESDILASTGLFSPVTTLFSILLLILLLSFSLWARTRYKLVSFAILFFFINHLVESSFLGLELYFEHRNYLPSMFLFLAFACLILQGRAYYIMHRRRFMQTLVTLAMLFLLIGEGATAWLRNEDWRSQRSLLEDAVIKAPQNIRPRISLAIEYMKTQEFDKAKKELKLAENLVKQFPDRYEKYQISLLYYNAGGLHSKLGNKNKALQLYGESIRYFQNEPQAHANLGYMYYLEGDVEHAEQYYVNALQLKMNDAKLYNMLARLYHQKKQYDKAKATLEAGIKIQNLPILSLNLIGVALAQNDTQEATRLFHQVPIDNNDLIYLLYKAVLQTEPQQEKTAQQLGQILFAKQTPLCDWIQEVKENAAAGVTYPDIHHIEPFIREGYNAAIDLIEQDLQKQKETTNYCVEPSQETTTSSF